MVLSTASVLVWRLLLQKQQTLLTRLTQNISEQASRRLEIFVESRLTTASIFAQRWATHEAQDFSRQRFTEFARILVREIPGYGSIRLIPADRGQAWIVASGQRASPFPDGPDHEQAIAEALNTHKTVLTGPRRTGSGSTRFFAVLPLQLRERALGLLVVEFDAESLISGCFHQRIRSEFMFRVEDGGKLLHRSYPRSAKAFFAKEKIKASRSFPLRNRRWRLIMVPREKLRRSVASQANLPYLLFGLLLALSVSGLVFLLSRRIKLHRDARDRAAEELRARVEAQAALRVSEERYRNVFNSATDSMLVLDREACQVINANRAAAELFGSEQEALVGRELRELLDPEHVPHYEKFREQLLESMTARLELPDAHLGDAVMHLEITGNVFQYDDTDRVLLIITDVTEQKRSELRLALLSRKVLIAQEEERARVSRDLHDELGQIITALHLELDWSIKRLALPESVVTEVFHGPRRMIENSAAELRRICDGLRPPFLDDLGAGPALELLVEEFEGRTGVKTKLEIQSDADAIDVPTDTGLCTYRILQEALTNIMRHAEASEVAVSLHLRERELLLSIYDNGVGMDLELLGGAKGSGITGMQERANLVNGRLEIKSVLNEGTRIVFRVPLPLQAREVDND